MRNLYKILCFSLVLSVVPLMSAGCILLHFYIHLGQRLVPDLAPSPTAKNNFRMVVLKRQSPLYPSGLQS